MFSGRGWLLSTQLWAAGEKQTYFCLSSSDKSQKLSLADVSTYDKVVALLIEAVKEQQTQIDELKSKLN